MIEVLKPLEQLFELNQEAYVKLDNLHAPLIVVGGQAVGYWLNYYTSMYDTIPEYIQDYYSVDIDYVAKLEDIRLINEEWKSKLLPTLANDPPPSLAAIILRDNLNNIKQKQGALFVDLDAYQRGKLEPNLIDVIDRPAGFSYEDMNTKSGLSLYTTPFIFPLRCNLKPHENLRILTPLGCLKSRIENHRVLKQLKSPEIERKRIKALMWPVVYYIQDQLHEPGFREAKKQIDLLTALIESKEGIRLSVDYGINLIDMLHFFADEHIEGLSDKFLKQELPRNLERILRKIRKCQKSPRTPHTA